MADDTNTPQSEAGAESSGRERREGTPREARQRDGGQRESGQRQAGQRDTGGFRIRLSDNELQAARALQEAFGLRSTVAVLGFALRTLAQQLEAGQLQELVAQQQALVGQRPPTTPATRGGGGDRDNRRGEGRGPGSGGGAGRSQRIDPFARPSRPAAPQPEPELSDQGSSEPEAAAAAAEEPGLEGLGDDGGLAGSEPESLAPLPAEADAQAGTGAADVAAVNPGDA